MLWEVEIRPLGNDGERQRVAAEYNLLAHGRPGLPGGQSLVLGSTRGYLLDPHSAIAYLGLKTHMPAGADHVGSAGHVGIFLATAHPAKFGEIVEPIIRTPIVTPAPLAEALARPHDILRIEASLEAVTDALGA